MRQLYAHYVNAFRIEQYKAFKFQFDNVLFNNISCIC